MASKIEWLLPIRFNEDIKTTIICFPHGGGSVSSFRYWVNLPTDANIWALNLPGRDSLIDHQPLTSATHLIEQIKEALLEKFTDRTIFYGHSMGAGLAFEAIITMQNAFNKIPDLFIATGRHPPHHHYPVKVENLTDELLLEYIENLSDLKRELPRHEEFLQFYIPKIRADYALNNSIPIHSATPLSIPMTIINGENDSLINHHQLAEWQQHTAFPLQSTVVAGGHFFMEKDPVAFLQLVSESIDSQ